MTNRTRVSAPTAVIFDLDGLLIDSESLHCACWMEALSSVGVDLDVATYADHWTRAGRGIEDFRHERGEPHDPLTLRARKSTSSSIRTGIATSPPIMPTSS